MLTQLNSKGITSISNKNRAPGLTIETNLGDQ